MKKIRTVLVFTLFFLTCSFSGFAYVIGDVNNDNKIDLTEAINALQVTSGVRTAAVVSATINVPADVPTIQQAINAARSGDIINVAAGIYSETLTINKAVTVQGAGSGSTTINGVSSTDVISIDGGKVVVISGITLQGGYRGIYARRGAVVEVLNAVVQDMSNHGIAIHENSTARLTNVTVQRSAQRGIQAHRSSSISFYGTVASNNNLTDGIGIVDSSSANFSSATVTANGNTRHGINVANNAGLISDNSSITIQNGLGNSDNSGRGIQAFNSSAISLQTGSSLLIDNNGYDGVGLGGAASFNLEDTCSMTVSNNKRYGLNIWGGAYAQLNGTVVVDTNASYGANITNSSSLLINNGAVDILNNVDRGISMWGGRLQVDKDGKLTVSGTTGAGRGINLGNQSSLGVSGSLLVQNNTGSDGRGISISNASQVTLNPTTPPSNTVVIQSNGIGIYATDGSAVSGSGSITIKNNTAKDINLIFGSRTNLPTSYYGNIQCDGTCLASGVTCPAP
jgi:hypothetical protein